MPPHTAAKSGSHPEPNRDEPRETVLDRWFAPILAALAELDRREAERDLRLFDGEGRPRPDL